MNLFLFRKPVEYSKSFFIFSLDGFVVTEIFRSIHSKDVFRNTHHMKRESFFFLIEELEYVFITQRRQYMTHGHFYRHFFGNYSAK